VRPSRAQIRDPAAFARFCAEAERCAAEATALELAEEAERSRREGGAYKPRAVREAEAKARRQRAEAAGGGADRDEARGVKNWCDVTKDYYRALGVDRLAATHEIKKAYKRLAMQARAHPLQSSVALVLTTKLSLARSCIRTSTAARRRRRWSRWRRSSRL